MKKFFFLLISLIMLFGLSCKKGPGPGGRATITGKVYAYDYKLDTIKPCVICDSMYWKYVDEYYVPGENVYLVYGDEPGIGKTVKTDTAGIYVFDELRPGKYKVFVLSKDTTSLAGSKLIEILEEVTITKRKENARVEDLYLIQ